MVVSEDDFFAPKPIETKGEYVALVAYARTKNTPESKRLLKYLSELKTDYDFYDFQAKMKYDYYIQSSDGKDSIKSLIEFNSVTEKALKEMTN